MTACRFPGCGAETNGRDAVFCVDHHFACEPLEARLLINTSIAARRAETPARREYLRDQLNGYVSVVVRKIRERQNKEASRVA